jgi:hypothetical protein
MTTNAKLIVRMLELADIKGELNESEDTYTISMNYYTEGECTIIDMLRKYAVKADLSYGYGKLEFDDSFVLNITDPNYEE